MPKIGVTVYNLLLSCPGDVVDLKGIIDECVKNFNSHIGEINNIRVELKHWSTDSFSQSGDKPQNILNKQFINDCDMCVALLGTRFGTPTDNYDSGTEEEIENMLKQNKQVFMYFVERDIDPSKINFDQYSKVKNFKEKYQNKGLYDVVKTDEDLRKSFQNALTGYLLKVIEPKVISSSSLPKPNLIITSQFGEKDKISLTHTDFLNINLVNKKRENIKALITKINNFKLEESENVEETLNISKIADEDLKKMCLKDVADAYKNKQISKTKYNELLGIKPPIYKKVNISDKDKALISKFCSENDICVNEKFWNLSSLIKEETDTMFNIYGKSINYKGSDEEKSKYDLFKELIDCLHKYNDIISYFCVIDRFSCFSFVVENNGTTYDEDVDIKIFIDKGHLTSNEDFPVPGIHFIKDIVDVEAPKFLFAGHDDADIDNYSNYSTTPYFQPNTLFPPFGKTEIEEYAELKDKYNHIVDNVFSYSKLETNTEDLLTFNINYLKQNTKMFFPSYLFFKSQPTYIRYEIRSKHSPNVYEGKFSIEKGVENE